MAFVLSIFALLCLSRFRVAFFSSSCMYPVGCSYFCAVLIVSPFLVGCYSCICVSLLLLFCDAQSPELQSSFAPQRKAVKRSSKQSRDLKSPRSTGSSTKSSHAGLTTGVCALFQSSFSSPHFVCVCACVCAYMPSSMHICVGASKLMYECPASDCMCEFVHGHK